MKLLVCAALAATLAIAQGSLQQATVPAIMATSSVTFGITGIATGQTARLNVLNLAVGGPIVVGGSCQITAAFLDAAGTTLATQTLSAGQGQAVHFDLPRSQAGSGADPVEIRATVSAAFAVSANTATFSPASCSVVPTMDIFDQSTGRTQTHMETTHMLSGVMPLSVLLQ